MLKKRRSYSFQKHIDEYFLRRCFDARSIAKENRLQVEELLNQREKSFEEKTAKRASAAAAPLAAWVSANVKYSRILEKIKPLELEQTKLQKYNPYNYFIRNIVIA